MPDWIKSALFWATAAVVMIALAAIPFSITLWLGLGWGIVFTAIVIAAITWLVRGAGPSAFAIAVPCWMAVGLGLIAAMVWLIIRFLLMAVA